MQTLTMGSTSLIWPSEGTTGWVSGTYTGDRKTVVSEVHILQKNCKAKAVKKPEHAQVSMEYKRTICEGMPP